MVVKRCARSALGVPPVHGRLTFARGATDDVCGAGVWRGDASGEFHRNTIIYRRRTLTGGSLSEEAVAQANLLYDPVHRLGIRAIEIVV